MKTRNKKKFRIEKNTFELVQFLRTKGLAQKDIARMAGISTGSACNLLQHETYEGYRNWVTEKTRSQKLVDSQPKEEFNIQKAFDDVIERLIEIEKTINKKKVIF